MDRGKRRRVDDSVAAHTATAAGRVAADAPAPKLSFAGNLALWHLGGNEAEQLYEEIFIKKQYEQHDVSVSLCTVPTGPVMIDVGANIGLFSLYCATRCADMAGTPTIVAVEPIPQVYAMLEKNLASSTNPLVACSTIHLHCAAAGSKRREAVSTENSKLDGGSGGGSSSSSSTAAFTFYTDNPAESTRYPVERAAQRRALLAAAAADLEAASQEKFTLGGHTGGGDGSGNHDASPEAAGSRSSADGKHNDAVRATTPPPHHQHQHLHPSPSSVSSEVLLPALTSFLQEHAHRNTDHAHEALGGDGSRQDALSSSSSSSSTLAQQGPSQGLLQGPPQALHTNTVVVRCAELTVSDLIDEHKLAYVDLLKVDVEGDELQVLLGVEKEHWPLIQQVVVEVHNIDNRLRTIQHLLQEQGFVLTTIHEKPTVEGGFLHYVPAALRLHMVYATRS